MGSNILIILISLIVIAVVAFIVFKTTKKKFEFKGESEFNSMLTEILAESFSTNPLPNVTQKIVRILKRYYKVEYVTVLILNNSNRLKVISSNIQGEYFKRVEQYCNEQLRSMEESIVKLHISENGTLDNELARLRGIKFSLFAPLIFKDNLIGAVLIEGTNIANLEKEKIREEIYGKIFKSTAMVLQNIIHTEKLVNMLSTDQLTGVFNRRYLDNKLTEEVNVHRNNKRTFNVALMDIDHFKKFNDTYGHQFGDLVLQKVSQIIQKNIRNSEINYRRNDWIARYGGEEFLIVFSNSNQKDIYNKVNRLREEISKLVLTDGETKANVTVSFGIATFPNHGMTPEMLIEKADEALYQSKNDGRNRVTIAK